MPINRIARPRPRAVQVALGALIILAAAADPLLARQGQSILCLARQVFGSPPTKVSSAYNPATKRFNETWALPTAANCTPGTVSGCRFCLDVSLARCDNLWSDCEGIYNAGDSWTTVSSTTIASPYFPCGTTSAQFQPEVLLSNLAPSEQYAITIYILSCNYEPIGFVPFVYHEVFRAPSAP